MRSWLDSFVGVAEEYQNLHRAFGKGGWAGVEAARRSGVALPAVRFGSGLLGSATSQRGGLLGIEGM